MEAVPDYELASVDLGQLIDAGATLPAGVRFTEEQLTRPCWRAIKACVDSMKKATEKMQR